MHLRVENISFSYQEEKKILDNINLHVEKGELVGIIGPNGSGKSTILKNIYRVLKPDEGAVFLDDEAVYQMHVKKAATKLGVVGQENSIPFDFTVGDIVAMGRGPHKGLLESDTEEDQRIVMNALKQVDLEHLIYQDYRQLSGGEKQRVIIARVLAQQTDFLILDEPTNHLDIHHQLQIFDLVKNIGVTVLAAIHDLNLAALYCDRIYLLKDGKLVTAGTPETVLTEKNIGDVFGIHTDIMIHPITKKVSITYLPESLAETEE
ncbi:heme ABC transporter ATP-binding protein [Pseudogracilibacillus sp. SE30717A]|uniref:heme ABC transporter ATP-binding protein n=1 Tax=Pseudogracilibacillus sp. SE30717A TaxID=3098293 RepID=UPI00300E4275